MIQRLEAMRRRGRRLLCAYGLSRMCVGAVLSFTGLIVLDWIFGFPGPLRFLFGLMWLTGVSWLLTRYVLSPLRADFNILHVATKVEEQFPQFEDRLTSSASFMAGGRMIEDPLQSRLIEGTEDIARGVPMEQVLSARPAWRMGGGAAALVLLAASLAAAAPHWTLTGVQRFAFPFAPVEWPRQVSIVPLTGDMTIARSESLVLAMEIAAGNSDNLRAFCHLQHPDGRTEKIPMRREGAARYAASLTMVDEPLMFWFSAGDDTTRDRPGHVRVVQRPHIDHVELTVLPPPYAARSSNHLQRRGASMAQVVLGGWVAVDFTVSKPPARQADGTLRAGLISAQDGFIPAKPAQETVLQDDPLQPQGELKLHTLIAPHSDSTYTIQVIDQDGFENAPHPPIAIRVVEDTPPAVSILRPLGALEVTPQAVVELEGSAVDDLGLERVWLAASIHPSEQTVDHTIDDWAIQDDPAGRAAVSGRHLWELGPLGLRIGDRVTYYLAAQDNRRTPELEPQVGASHRLQLKVVSPSQLTASVAAELGRLADRLKEQLQRQQQLAAETEDLLEDPAAVHSVEIERSLLRVAARQRKLATDIAEARRQAESLAETLERNNIEGAREQVQIEHLVGALVQAVEPAMQSAAGQLHETRAQTDGDLRVQDIRQAVAGQHAAAAALQALIGELVVWDDFNSVTANLRELSDQQQQVAQKTAILQDKTIGQDAAALSDDVKAELEANARDQDRLTEAIGRALLEMQALRERLLHREPEDEAALAETLRRLTAGEIQSLSRRAAEAVRDNRTGQAQADQNTIERTLAEAVSQLESKQARKLSQLSKKLAEFADMLAEILKQQNALLATAEGAGDEDIEVVFPEAAGDQRRLQAHTAATADLVGEVPEAADAAQITDLAAGAMTRATDGLYDLDAPAALGGQREAITRLEEALQRLQTLEDETARALAAQELFALKRALLDIRRKQLEVNGHTTKLAEAVEQGGRTRRLSREAREQARAQGDIAAELEGLGEKLAATPVYMWVQQRTVEAMQTGARLLETSQLGVELPRTQERIVLLLDRLIEAIRQAEQMASEQPYAEGDGGGGGEGGPAGGPQKAVPTVAELIVLKGVQEDILLRTRQIAEDMAGDASESLLREVEQLGRDQDELQRLTRELTTKAREGQ